MNDQTVDFQCMHDIFTISDADFSTNTNVLADFYNVDKDQFMSELIMFRPLYPGIAFTHFADFAKSVFLKCSEKEFPLITFFTQIILILPFATADCERSFSAMNRIKSDELGLRSQLKSILMDILLLYDIISAEKSVWVLLILLEKFTRKFGNIRSKINLALSLEQMLTRTMQGCSF